MRLFLVSFLFYLFLKPTISFAEVCGKMWDGDASRAYALNNKFQGINFDSTPILNKQLEVFYQAKEKISRIAGISPKFVICNDQAPNAFAMNIDGRAVIGVSLGMLSFTNGDEDMAAAVIAHEVSHHTLGHRERGQSSQFAVDLVTGILGILADAAIQSRYSIQNSSIGRDIASVGSNLISSKFSRDYEREADDNGFKYMVAAGYNPEGGLRLANSFIQKGFSTSSGWFNDTHPGWDERAERYRTMISKANVKNSIAVVAQNTKSESNNTLLLNGLDISTNQETTAKSVPKETTPNSPAPIVELTQDEKNIQDILAAMSREDYSESLKKSKLLIKSGNPRGNSLLALHYVFGYGVKKDIPKAINYYEIALNKKVYKAAAGLGVIYLEKKNYLQALKYFNLGAKNGDLGSYMYLASMYAYGEGVEKNMRKSIEYQTLIAEQGDATFARYVGMYWSGYNEDRDSADQPNKLLAVKYLTMAAEQNDAHALSTLGYMYLYGDGVEQKPQLAIKYLENAASQNYSLGKRHLGFAYFRGTGVTKDEIKGCKYIIEESGTQEQFVKYYAGFCYLNGYGVKADKEKALTLIKESADLGFKDAIDYLTKIGQR